MKHPIQPVIVDEDGLAVFKKNAIVRFLLDSARDLRIDLNTLQTFPFSKEDWNQFVQLLGYSVSAFEELTFADPEIVAKVALKEERLRTQKPKRGRVNVLIKHTDRDWLDATASYRQVPTDNQWLVYTAVVNGVSRAVTSRVMFGGVTHLDAGEKYDAKVTVEASQLYRKQA